MRGCWFCFLLLIFFVYFSSSSSLVKPEVKQNDLKVNHLSLGGMLVDEKKRFVFCPIEKVASTQFKQLFYRLNNDENWFEPPYHKPNSPRLGHYSLSKVKEILHDSSWTKAVFFRDPTKRLLSSFLHLVLNPRTPPRYRAALSSRHKNISWPDFVEAVLEKDGYDNLHWTPQSHFCGLKRFYPYLNFVGNFEYLRDHGNQLISRVKLEDSTSSGWGKTAYVKSPVVRKSTPEERRVKYKELLRAYYAKNISGSDCMWCMNLALHKNNYKKNPLNKALSVDMWTRLRHSGVYSPDYSLFLNLRHVSPFNPYLYDSYRRVVEGDKRDM